MKSKAARARAEATAKAQAEAQALLKQTVTDLPCPPAINQLGRTLSHLRYFERYMAVLGVHDEVIHAFERTVHLAPAQWAAVHAVVDRMIGHPPCEPRAQHPPECYEANDRPPSNNTNETNGHWQAGHLTQDALIGGRVQERTVYLHDRVDHRAVISLRYVWCHAFVDDSGSAQHGYEVQCHVYPSPNDRDGEGGNRRIVYSQRFGALSAARERWSTLIPQRFM